MSMILTQSEFKRLVNTDTQDMSEIEQLKFLRVLADLHDTKIPISTYK